MTIWMSKTNPYVLISTNCQLAAGCHFSQASPALGSSLDLMVFWGSFQSKFIQDFKRANMIFTLDWPDSNKDYALSKRSLPLNILPLKSLELKWSANERIYYLKPELIGDLCHRGTLSWNHLLEEEIETLLEILLKWCDLLHMTLCLCI